MLEKLFYNVPCLKKKIKSNRITGCIFNIKSTLRSKEKSKFEGGKKLTKTLVSMQVPSSGHISLIFQKGLESVFENCQ